jgi:hypothetical protein
MKKIYFLFLSLFITLGVWGQYSLTASTYTQNFDGLGTGTSINVTDGSLSNINTSLEGWYFLEQGTNANTTITAGTGSLSTGDTYNFGLAANADRALGGLRSNPSSFLNPIFGFYFTNNTGNEITALQISYTGKTWRRGFNNRPDKLDFQYNTTATTLSGTGGIWTDVNELDYSTPVTGLPPASGSILHTASINNYILDITIPDGASFFIRWYDLDATDADDGMSIDDFTLTVADPTINNFYSKSSGNLTNTSTWGTNTDGTGTAPSNFTNPFQNFHLTNRTSATLDANWAVSGAISKVITGDGSSSTTLIIPPSAALTGVVDVSNLATLRLENATLPTIGIIENGSTINYAQVVNYEVPAFSTYHNLTITGGTKTIEGGSTTITGNFLLDGVNFTGSGFTEADITLTGDFTMQNGATVGATGIRPRLVLDGSGTQALSGGDFRLNSLETDDLSGNRTIVLNNANLLLNGEGLDLRLATQRLSLNGNTLTIEGNATLAFQGEGLGSITGSSTSNITINKIGGFPIGILRMTSGSQILRNLSLYDISSGGPMELGSPLSIINNLNFLVSGRIITTATNLLTVQQGGTITGGGPNTYVEGPLAWVTNAVGDYLFPIGALGNTVGKFIVVKIETGGNSSTFMAQYFETGAANLNSPPCDFNVTGTYGIGQLKIDEHYNISRTIGTSAARITFDFDGDLNDAEWNTTAPEPTEGVVMAHYNTSFSCWEIASNQVLVYPPIGNITTDLLTNFSPFVFGKIAFGSLPVKFGNVKAYQQGSGVRIDWSNLTESDLVNYTIERSADGQIFTPLSTVNPILNNGSRADYSYFDATPLNGINFYRIQSLETDGKKLYSVIVRVDTKNDNIKVTIYPNPVTDGQLLLQTSGLQRGSYIITVVNAVGQQVHSKSLNHAGGGVTQSVQLPESLKPGIYSLQMMSDGVKLTKTFIVQ